MKRNRWVLAVFVTMVGVLLGLVVPKAWAKTLYVGGSFGITSPAAKESTVVLNAFEDYVKYVNETKKLAPWRTETFPEDVTLEVLWRDDGWKPAKALSIYEQLKGKGMLVYRASGSPTALALKGRLKQDNMGATSMASGAYLLTPPQTIFTLYPIYTDALASIADWFKENWKESRKPRVAYLTADNAMGKSIEIPEMKAYLEKIGYEFVGAQYVPLIPSAPPTTQLSWLKKNKVDLALGVMINAGSQPTIKEAVRLDMGPQLSNKITFGFASPSHLGIFCPAMGAVGDGTVVAGSYPDMHDLDVKGIKFCNELQSRYRPDKRTYHIMYPHGIIEAMTQVEALRLALERVPPEKLTSADVLEQGFYRIKGLDTGELSSTPLTYGPDQIEGVDKVRVDQAQNGKPVKLGVWPCRGLYPR